MDIVNHGGPRKCYYPDTLPNRYLKKESSSPPPKKKKKKILRFWCKHNEILSLNLAENCEGLHLKDEDRTT